MALKRQREARENPGTDSRFWPASDWIRLALALGAVVATAIWLLGGRDSLGVANQWVIAPNLRAWPVGAWGLPLGVVTIFGGAAALATYDRFGRARSRKEQKTSVVTALVCLGLLGILWPWALLGPGQLSNRPGTLTLEGRFNIIAAMWSDVATGYFGTAYQIDDARQFTRQYAAQWQRVDSPAQAHVATHPPGATLWFYSARRFYEEVPAVSGAFEGLATTLTSQTRTELLQSAQLARTTASQLVRAPQPAPLPPSAVGSALFCATLLGLSLVAAIPAVYGLAALDHRCGSFFDTGNHPAEETFVDNTPKVDETQARFDEREKRGLLAVFLWVLAPTVNLFAFTLDALVAAGVAWTLFLAARGLAGLNRTSVLFSLSAGAMLALTSFLSLGALAAVAILVFAAIGLRRRAALLFLLPAALALGLTWIVLALWGGFNPLEIGRDALDAHALATLQSRTHLPWIGMNVLMWVLFAGWPLVVLGAKKLARNGRNSQFEAAQAFGVAAILTILLLTLGGNVRGEVERLWLFTLAPLAAWAANGVSWRLATALVALQGAQTLVMAATLAPLVRPF